MSTSPSKRTTPHLAPSNITSTSTLPPSSPRTNRSLRRLQSAHSLSSQAAAGSNSPSLISQQRQQQQRNLSFAHKDFPSTDIPPVPRLASHGRSRSNSDAAVTSISHHGPTTRRNAAAKRIVTPALGVTKDVSLDTLVRQGPPDRDVAAALRDMRHCVLTDGIQSDSDGMSSLRIYVWLILLSAPPLRTDDYLALIHRGASPAYAKIRNDTFRTLATDPLFRRRVSESSLIRVLNAIAWRLHDSKEERANVLKPGVTNVATATGSPELVATSPDPMSAKPRGRSHTVTTEGSEMGGQEAGTYVQGMNVLAAPFLYAARSEAEGFVAFHCLITRECPGYVRGAMDGVHRGLSEFHQLVDKVLGIVDPKLSSYLLSKGMQAKLYAFASVLTLCACTPPLPEVLHLWDFLFAYGAHLNVLCIVAQLIMARESILGSSSPMKVLRSFPPLQATKIKMTALSLVKKIPETVYSEIVSHAK
ncbi:MAG: hypothetical protein M1833_000287 [Piccolia ochrophora]|nr:MAG: hypothetical protein M1833_000287 [Piccolia ochrophora]